jgi:hypothetical protein
VYFWRFIFNFNKYRAPCFEVRKSSDFRKVVRIPLAPCAISGNSSFSEPRPAPTSIYQWTTVSAPEVMPELPFQASTDRQINKVELNSNVYLECDFNLKGLLEQGKSLDPSIGITTTYNVYSFAHFSLSALVTTTDTVDSGTLVHIQPVTSTQSNTPTGTTTSLVLDATVCANGERACSKTMWSVGAAPSTTRTFSFSAVVNGDPIDPGKDRGFVFDPNYVQAWWAGMDSAYFMVSNTNAIAVEETSTEEQPRFGFILDQGWIDRAPDDGNKRWSRHSTSRMNYKLAGKQSGTVSFFAGDMRIFIGGSPEGDTFIGGFHQLIIDPASGGQGDS